MKKTASVACGCYTTASFDGFGGFGSSDNGSDTLRLYLSAHTNLNEALNKARSWLNIDIVVVPT